MEEINKLIALCKASVTISINEHTDCYQTVADWLSELDPHDYPEKDIADEMIKRGVSVCIQFYPLTPIGFYRVYHYDVELAAKEAVEFLEQLKTR